MEKDHETNHFLPKRSGSGGFFSSVTYHGVISHIKSGSITAVKKLNRRTVRAIIRKECLENHPVTSHSAKALTARYLMLYEIFQEVQSTLLENEAINAHSLQYKPGRCPLCLEGALSAVNHQNVGLFHAVLQAGFPVSIKLKSNVAKTSPQKARTLVQQVFRKELSSDSNALMNLDMGFCLFFKIALLPPSEKKNVLMSALVGHIDSSKDAKGREFRYNILRNLVFFRRECLEEAVGNCLKAGGPFFPHKNTKQPVGEPCLYNYSNLASPEDVLAILFDHSSALPPRHYSHLASRVFRNFLDLLKSGNFATVSRFITNTYLAKLLRDGCMISENSTMPKVMLLPGPNVSIAIWLNTSVGTFYVAENRLLIEAGQECRVVNRLTDIRSVQGSSRDWRAFIRFVLRGLNKIGLNTSLGTSAKEFQRISRMFCSKKWFLVTTVFKEMIKMSVDYSIFDPKNDVIEVLSKCHRFFNLSPAKIILDVTAEDNPKLSDELVQNPFKVYLTETAEIMLLLKVLGDVRPEGFQSYQNSNWPDLVDNSFLELFPDLCTSSPTLQDLCRRCIRKKIGTRGLFDKIDQLKLPKKFKSFLKGDILSLRKTELGVLGRFEPVEEVDLDNSDVPKDGLVWHDKPQRIPGPGILSWASEYYCPEVIALLDILEGENCRDRSLPKDLLAESNVLSRDFCNTIM